MGGAWSVESWTGVAAKFRRRGLGTTRRSNDLQRRYKSYSLSGAAEGRLGEKYCFWFSPVYRTKVTHGCETRRWWMLMYSIKGIGVIWRNVVRGSSGCCEIRWKHASVGWLQSTNLLWRTYWIVDTIQSEFRPCPSPVRIVASPLNSNRRDARRATRARRKQEATRRFGTSREIAARPRSIKN